MSCSYIHKLCNNKGCSQCELPLPRSPLNASMPLTVSRSLTISVCHALSVPHYDPLSHYISVSRSLSASLRFARSLPHCVSLSKCLTVSCSLTVSRSHNVTRPLSPLPHCVSLAQCLAVSRSLTVSLSLVLTVSHSDSLSQCLTVSPSLSASAPHCVSLSHCLTVSRSHSVSLCLTRLTATHCASLSHYITVSRSHSASLCLTRSLPHCVSHSQYLTAVSRSLSISLLCLALSVPQCLTVSRSLSASLCLALSPASLLCLALSVHTGQHWLCEAGIGRAAAAAASRCCVPLSNPTWWAGPRLDGSGSGPPPAAPILPAALGGAPAQMATDSAQHADLIQSCRLRAVGRAPLFLMPLVPTLHSRGHARRPSDRRGCISRPDCAGRGLLDLRHPHPVSSREVPASPALAARVRPATEPNDRSHTARACCARVAKVRASWGRDTYTGLSATGLWRFL
jgi:hypothetical protein